jgi:hypothetical protein
MEQNLLNSSRYKISSLSIDSRFADRYTDPANPTADFTIRLPSTMRNIMRIRLSSVELPLVEPVFSRSKQNVQFVVDVSGATRTVAISSGDYTVEGFRAAIQNALLTVDSGFSCSISPSGVMTIANSRGPFVLHLESDPLGKSSFWGIGYYMGFRVKDVSGSPVTPATGSSVVWVQPTPYYLLQLKCPALLENITHRIAKNASIPAFAKLILRNGPLGLQFDDNANLLRKEFTFLAPTDIFALNVRIVDPFGEMINMGNMHWSMTFELTEVVNSNVAGVLHRTFSRGTGPP